MCFIVVEKFPTGFYGVDEDGANVGKVLGECFCSGVGDRVDS